MEDTYTNRRAETDFATVKVEGQRDLVQTIIEFLEKHFISFRTSKYRENSQDTGVHVYITVRRRSDG
jgi:hypothetical protein